MTRRKKPSRPIFLEPPRLTWPSIREKAEEFRRKHVDPVDTVPVPIIEIVEIGLGIEPIPIPGMLKRIDIDGFLTKDLKHICIDETIYMDDRYLNRLRFTYAHEIGHHELHQDQIKMCDFRDTEDWIFFHQDFRDEDLMWFENQAREFAGRLLVPKERLLKELMKLERKIIAYRRKMKGDEEAELIEAVSRHLCKIFAVSYQVIQKRIRAEKLWEELAI